jgi:hypothetical protein
MDKKYTHTHTHTHTIALFSHKEQNYVIYRTMDGTGSLHAQRNKLDSHRKRPHVFSHMCKLDLKNKN